MILILLFPPAHIMSIYFVQTFSARQTLFKSRLKLPTTLWNNQKKRKKFFSVCLHNFSRNCLFTLRFESYVPRIPFISFSQCRSLSCSANKSRRGSELTSGEVFFSCKLISCDAILNADEFSQRLQLDTIEWLSFFRRNVLMDDGGACQDALNHHRQLSQLLELSPWTLRSSAPVVVILSELAALLAHVR